MALNYGPARSARTCRGGGGQKAKFYMRVFVVLLRVYSQWGLESTKPTPAETAHMHINYGAEERGLSEELSEGGSARKKGRTYVVLVFFFLKYGNVSLSSRKKGDVCSCAFFLRNTRR